jgi:DNA-binding response OmpR family regulator
MASKHVLVVDDDPSILDLLSRALTTTELRVSTARRVSLARDVLARQKIDLIITDARSPGETGLCLTDTARDLGIAYILISGDPEWASDHGLAPDQYLAKPFNLSVLAQLVQAHLNAATKPF